MRLQEHYDSRRMLVLFPSGLKIINPRICGGFWLVTKAIQKGQTQTVLTLR